MLASPLVLLTDFGHTDPYVGIMKGVITSVAPELTILDLSHGVPPQDVRTAALYLESAWRWFPEGSVFCCVVDPGVGSQRRPVVLRSSGRLFVGPDNGLLSLVPNGDWWEIKVDTPLPSRTFHGRDLFAPVAARLGLGMDPQDVGPRVLNPATLPLPETSTTEGEILYFDHYGNAITSLREVFEGAVEVEGKRIPVHATYSEVRMGAPLALIGSTGRLEVSVRNGSAQRELALAVGTRVRHVR